MKDIEPIEIDAKVDTGATLLVIPEKVSKDFVFPIIRKQTVKEVEYNPDISRQLISLFIPPPKLLIEK